MDQFEEVQHALRRWGRSVAYVRCVCALRTGFVGCDRTGCNNAACKHYSASRRGIALDTVRCSSSLQYRVTLARYNTSLQYTRYRLTVALYRVTVARYCVSVARYCVTVPLRYQVAALARDRVAVVRA